MDIGTIIGIIVGLGLIIGSILLGGSLSDFIDIPSLMIVFGGTIAATFIAYPMKTALMVFKVVSRAFLHKPQNFQSVIESAVDYSNTVKAQGVIALDKKAKEEKNPFFSKGLQMIADGTSAGIVNDILTAEIGQMKDKHAVGYNLMNDMGKFAPAFGMIGTLIGLVQMLAGLDDPSSIGPKMAVALLTTFYGSVIANLICIPISVKLQGRSKEESLSMRVVVEATKGISKGESRNIIEDRLAIFLSGEMKKKSEGKGN